MQFSGQCCGFFYLLMVALCNRADDIYFHPDVCSFFLLFSSPNLSGWRLDVSCVSYFHTWCGLSANLECRSEMCCTVHAARWKCRTQKNRQNSPSGYHRAPLSRYIFAIKTHIDNRKKIVKQHWNFSKQQRLWL